ncbi:MAG: hypothetical protein ACO2ZM_04275 [Francisellaceae bacterium]
MKRITYTKRMMVLLSVIVLMGCSSGGDDDSSSIEVSTEISLTENSLDVIVGASSTLTVSAANTFTLMTAESVAAKDIQFYFDDNADESKFTIGYSSACGSLEPSQSCLIEFSPKADSGYEKDQTISGWIEGSNTPKYPFSFTIEKFSLASDSNVIGAGEALTFTLSHTAKNTISDIELSTSNGNLSVENNACGQALAAGESCQFDLIADNDANDEPELKITINGVDYSTVWPLSLIRPVIVLSSSDDSINASDTMTITLSNSKSVTASGLNISQAIDNLNANIAGISLNESQSTCGDSLKGNSQCLLVMDSDDTLAPGLSAELAITGSNFDASSMMINTYTSELSVTTSPKVITANSGIVETITVSVSNNSDFDAENLTLEFDDSRLSLDSDASDCDDLAGNILPQGESCQYSLVYDPGVINAYHLFTTDITIASDQSGIIEKSLTIHNFISLYTVPMDLNKLSNQISHQNVSSYAEYLIDDMHYIAIGTFGGGLSFSEDGGENWRILTTVDGFPSNNISGVIFNDDGVLYVHSDNGVAISDDFTQSWQYYLDEAGILPDNSMRSILGLSATSKLDFTVKDSLVYLPTVLPGNKQGLLVLNPENNTLTQYFNGSHVYAVIVDDHYIYVGHEDGLYISDDHGQSWENILEKTASPIVSDANIHDFTVGDGIIYFVYDDMEDEFGSSNGIMRYDVESESFLSNYTKTSTSNGLISHKISQLLYKDGALYVATHEGLSVLDAEGHWKSYTTADGLSSNYLIGLYVNGQKIVTITDMAGITISEDGGENWDHYFNNANTPIYNLSYDLFIKGDDIYLGTVGNGLSISFDNGLNWSAYQQNDSVASSLSDDFIRAIYVDDEAIYVATRLGGFAVSNDNGNSWQIFDDLGSNTYSEYSSSLAVKDDTIYIGGYDIVAKYTISTQQLSNPIELNVDPNWKYPAVALASQNGSLYVGTSGDGLYITSNDGSSWIHYDDNTSDATTSTGCMLAFDEVRNLAIAEDGTLYAGYSAHNYQNRYGFTVIKSPLSTSTASCKTYTTSNSDLSYDEVGDIFIAKDGMAYIATYGGGISVFDPSTETIIKTYTVGHDDLGSNYVHNIFVIDNILYASTTGGISKLKLSS